LPAIINYFQDCSTFHSESIGDGVAAMKKRGYAWILSSWQIIVNRYPKLYEEIKISTWAYGWKSFFGFRNYTMEDSDGNILAYANTNWLYMNLHTGHPERIPKEVSDAYHCEPPLSMEMASRKIHAPETGIAMEPILVHKLDIDSNQHVNNGRYVPMAQECLPKGFVTHQLRVEYRKSAVYGDTIYPVVTTEGTKTTVCLNDSEGTPYAVVVFEEENS
jgi:acyl-ACP thioesterase